MRGRGRGRQGGWNTSGANATGGQGYDNQGGYLRKGSVPSLTSLANVRGKR